MPPPLTPPPPPTHTTHTTQHNSHAPPPHTHTTPTTARSDALLHVYACDQADRHPQEEEEESKDERGFSSGHPPSFSEEKEEQGGGSSQGQQPLPQPPPSILFVGESLRDAWLADDADADDSSRLPWLGPDGDADEDDSLPSAALMGLGNLDLPPVPAGGRRMELKGACVCGGGGERPYACSVTLFGSDTRTLPT